MALTPWQKATPAALTIIEKTLKLMETLDVTQEMKNRIWTAIVDIAHVVMSADLDRASPQPTIESIERDRQMRGLEIEIRRARKRLRKAEAEVEESKEGGRRSERVGVEVD